MHKFAYALIGLAAIAGTSSVFAQPNAAEIQNKINKMLEKYDKDGDGEFNQQERDAIIAEAEKLRAELEAAVQEDLIKRAEANRVRIMEEWDKNGDGRIDEQERQAARAGFRRKADDDAQKQRLIEGDVRRKLLQWYDKDGDGKLNAAEKAAAQSGFLNVLSSVSEPETRRSPGGRTPIDSATLERLRAEREAQQRQLEAAFDKNKDGQLSDEERQAMLEDSQKKRDAAQARFTKLFDMNGDGVIDNSERDAMRAVAQKRREEDTKKYDKNGDGTVDSNEREAMYDDRQKQLEEATKKYDANGNGYLEFEEEEKAYADGALEGVGYPPPSVGFGSPRINRPERGGRPSPPRREDIRLQRPGS